MPSGPSHEASQPRGEKAPTNENASRYEGIARGAMSSDGPEATPGQVGPGRQPGQRQSQGRWRAAATGAPASASRR